MQDMRILVSNVTLVCDDTSLSGPLCCSVHRKDKVCTINAHMFGEDGVSLQQISLTVTPKT